MKTVITPLNYLDVFICIMGLALHVSMKWAEVRKHGELLSFFGYIKTAPAQTAVAILAAVGTFTVAYAVGWIHAGMAFACGYMGSSIAENIAGQYSRVPK